MYCFTTRRIFTSPNNAVLQKTGAGDEARTRDLNLGKVALYQLSYSRVVLLTAALLTATTLLLPPLLQTACIGETRLWRNG
ncbi:conserved hypothetical protein [Paraburkholderia ribeironis]|uniref:Uncharacterized protein n=1 Tax=Paraburkholderia ribeironis TaxID=1247936 RepID=A0A1N7SNV7_9BURK|nr:conserved hypothetical protein [Paraburkholderia ribeironis]